MSDSVDKSFEDVLKLYGDRSNEKILGDIPAKVLKYDPATQTVEVLPLIGVVKNGVLRPVTILQQVQVRWPAGSTWSVAGDLVAGDFGWVVPAGGDISAWKMQGTEQDPTALPRKAKPSDVRFEPGSQPISTPLPSTAWKIGSLVIKAASLLLGDSSATLAAARHTDPVTFDNAMLTWMSQVETFINGIAPGTVAPLSSLIPYVGAVEATTTRVKVS